MTTDKSNEHLLDDKRPIGFVLFNLHKRIFFVTGYERDFDVELGMPHEVKNIQIYGEYGEMVLLPAFLITELDDSQLRIRTPEYVVGYKRDA